MISVDFSQLNESLKTFILSFTLGSQAVIDSLVDTADRYLDELDRLEVDTLNVKLHFEASVSIISQAYSSLVYINFHSADLFSDRSLRPLDSVIDSISSRFTSALDRIKREVPNVR